jgi:hypothetical protein
MRIAWFGTRMLSPIIVIGAIDVLDLGRERRSKGVMRQVTGIEETSAVACFGRTWIPQPAET